MELVAPRRSERIPDVLCWMASGTRGLVDKLLYRASEKATGIRRVWKNYPLLCSLLQETRSFLGHIETVCDTRVYRHAVVDLGPAFEILQNGSLVLNTRTQTRISSTKKLHEHYPWNSAVDLQIFLLGWDTGNETIPRNCGFGT